MFKLGDNALNAIKAAIFPQLIPAPIGPQVVNMACGGCMGTCTNSCKGSCKGSCKDGCTRTCKGNSR